MKENERSLCHAVISVPDFLQGNNFSLGFNEGEEGSRKGENFERKNPRPCGSAPPPTFWCARIVSFLFLPANNEGLNEETLGGDDEGKIDFDIVRQKSRGG